MRTNERPGSTGLGRGIRTLSCMLALAKSPRRAGGHSHLGMRGGLQWLSAPCQGAPASGQCFPCPTMPL